MTKSDNVFKIMSAVVGVWLASRIVRAPDRSDTIELLTKGYADALRAAMNGDAIYTPRPAADPYNYYKEKWITSGHPWYLKKMIQHVRLED